MKHWFTVSNDSFHFWKFLWQEECCKILNFSIFASGQSSFLFWQGTIVPNSFLFPDWGLNDFSMPNFQSKSWNSMILIGPGQKLCATHLHKVKIFFSQRIANIVVCIGVLWLLSQQILLDCGQQSCDSVMLLQSCFFIGRQPMLPCPLLPLACLPTTVPEWHVSCVRWPWGVVSNETAREKECGSTKRAPTTGPLSFLSWPLEELVAFCSVAWVGFDRLVQNTLCLKAMNHNITVPFNFFPGDRKVFPSSCLNMRCTK